MPLSEQAQQALARMPGAYEYNGCIVGLPGVPADTRGIGILTVEGFESLVTAARADEGADRKDAARWRSIQDSLSVGYGENLAGEIGTILRVHSTQYGTYPDVTSYVDALPATPEASHGS